VECYGILLADWTSAIALSSVCRPMSLSISNGSTWSEL